MSTSLLSPHLACGSISARALWASGRSMMQTEQYTAKAMKLITSYVNSYGVNSRIISCITILI